MNLQEIEFSNKKNSAFIKSPGKSNKIELLSLMKEMNLNCKLQEEILHFADNGKCLPYVPKELISSENTDPIAVKKLLKLPPRPLQRMKTKIVSLGSYEREPYRPDPSKTRPAEEKSRLQNMMAFGKDFSEEIVKNVSKDDDTAYRMSSTDLFDEILKEIKERRDFLEDMDQLGLRKKYSSEIQCQIILRLKELEKLDKDRAQVVFQEYGT